MIIIKISGGLGNQLFQYCFGRSVSAKLNTKLKFDFQLESTDYNFTNRNNGLSKFNLSLEKASLSEILKFKKFNKGFPYRIERKLAQKMPSVFGNLKVENTTGRSGLVISDNAYYDGYWQSETYFNSISEILKNEVSLSVELMDDAKQVLNSIITSTSVSVHIRRGDYVNLSVNQSIFHSCSLEYYKQAMDHIRKTVVNPHFFIFSDDVQWIKTHFSGKDINLVDVNDKSAEIDFWLMKHCRHQIIANSSFSWWAAWLNQNEDKIVIAPEKWYKDPRQNALANQHLIPKNWLKM